MLTVDVVVCTSRPVKLPPNVSGDANDRLSAYSKIFKLSPLIRCMSRNWEKEDGLLGRK
jgi:hypothetical protein